MAEWTAAQIAAALRGVRALSDDADQPPWVRRMARAGLERLSQIESAAKAGDKKRVKVLVARLDNLIPPGLRGAETVDTAREFIDVDEAATPPTVTVHWERIPRKLRRQTASLASAYVDLSAPPEPGGRPTKRAGKSGQ